MAITNHERVGKSLDLLKQGLQPFVERELKAQHAQLWFEEAKSAVSKITLSGSDNLVSWKTDGYSKSGFKIVWSKNTAPTYPTRDGDKYIYLSDSSASSTKLEAFNGGGTYYVRVCEYLGGACGVYSNEITLTL